MDPSSGPSAPPHPAFSEPTTRSNRRSYPATTHFALLAAVIIPIAFVPYVLCRRQVSVLHRRVVELEGLTKILQKDLNSAVSANGSWKDEHRRIRALVHQIVGETEELRTHVRLRDDAYDVSEQATQSKLQRLLEEARVARAQGNALRTLGPSIADIAAFMHEVELHMPLELVHKPRVEQLRVLALMLQNLPKNDEYIVKQLRLNLDVCSNSRRL